MTAHRLSFEDVGIGDEVPEFVKGPLTSVHLMRWSATTENWHRIHYDFPFAVAHDKLPGLLIHGDLKLQFVFQCLIAWVGDSGWVWKVSIQLRDMSLAGETLTIWARVQEKERAANYGVVTLSIGIRNEDGRESVRGSAVIALPYKRGPAVPYPFQSSEAAKIAEEA
jgi:acyl dehydratase